MRRHSALRRTSSWAMLLGAALACSFPGATTTVDLDAAATQTLQALATIAAGTLGAGATPIPPASETPAPPASPTATATVVHLVRPDSPGAVAGFVIDSSSSPLASQRRAIADSFNTNVLERPFTSQAMDYQPYLDLTRAEWSASGAWYYVTLEIEELPPARAMAAYAVELDLDLDGRGDWLIFAAAPPTTDWTTDGVRALEDTNNDVGGPTVLRPDPPSQQRDGYDRLVFDSGKGSDPDAAWVRLSPTGVGRIEIAFKSSLVGGDNNLIWGVWSDGGPQTPGRFDYHDDFTLGEAGSPLSNSSDYPLKALASVDSACRWVFGFVSNGTEPGVCKPPPTPTPT
ncbi:MAG TPA: hypothetical protein VGA32_06360, partial [Anaerolineales bacterium]